jgi:hypothetical protein
MIIFAKWSTPLHFAKMVIFTCVLPSFCRSIFVVISNSALTPMCNYYDAHTLHDDATTPSLPRLSIANATPLPPIVTTPTPITKPAQAASGHKRWQCKPK